MLLGRAVRLSRPRAMPVRWSTLCCGGQQFGRPTSAQRLAARFPAKRDCFVPGADPVGHRLRAHRGSRVSSRSAAPFLPGAAAVILPGAVPCEKLGEACGA